MRPQARGGRDSGGLTRGRCANAGGRARRSGEASAPPQKVLGGRTGSRMQERKAREQHGLGPRPSRPRLHGP